ncbi:Short-chain dehydrogenase protein [Rutstroemia sp. NJR-2017a WRK4]|nr:Short-chain dehydrogenase protein [Rutstroemia sp. NJR-2017a WRK4]
MVSFDINTTGSDVVKHFFSQSEGKTCSSPFSDFCDHFTLSRAQLTLSVAITGPSENSIGAETAITLASANPKKNILVGRTESKVTPVIEAIKKANPSIEVAFVEIDLLSNKSVRQAAEKIETLTDKIHVLINNAGVMAVRNYITSTDGVESQFAANYLGHFLLTNLLVKEILAAASEGARIVQVGSLGYQLGETNLEDINFQDGKTYNPWIAYGQAKTAMILFNVALSERLKQKEGGGGGGYDIDMPPWCNSGEQATGQFWG